MKTRTVERVVTPPPTHFVGDGFKVHNFIPGTYGLDMQRMDPFIMLDYNSKYEFPPSDKPKGVGVHPHKGFETVTIAYQGKVAHHDSYGGGGVIEEGDVQWMTAAKGLLHKEYHEEEWSKQGGVFQMVQLWVNLPKKYKLSEPKYQAIKSSEMKKVELSNNSGSIDVIAGMYNNEAGPASTFSPIHMMNARVKNGGTASFSFPSHFNTILLAIEGSFVVNSSDEVKTDHLVLMANDGEEFTIEATDDCVVLVLSGEPLREPIAAHGPFVMNTREELIEAFNEFNEGKFGVLED